MLSISGVMGAVMGCTPPHVLPSVVPIHGEVDRGTEDQDEDQEILPKDEDLFRSAPRKRCPLKYIPSVPWWYAEGVPTPCEPQGSRGPLARPRASPLVGVPDGGTWWYRGVQGAPNGGPWGCAPRPGGVHRVYRGGLGVPEGGPEGSDTPDIGVPEGV